MLETLGPSAEHAVNGVEAWWIAKALEVWGEELRSLSLFCFGDNTAAVSGCIKGYARSPNVACVVGAIHDLMCTFDIRCWFEYVHTASNPLDAASREGGEAALRELGAEVVATAPTLTVDFSRCHCT